MKHLIAFTYLSAVFKMLWRPTSCLAIQPRRARLGLARLSPSPLRRQSHTPSIINTQRDVSFISISLPKWHFKSPNVKRIRLNYWFPKVLALPDSVLFLSPFFPASSLPSAAPPGPGVSLAQTLCSSWPPYRWVLFDHIIFIDWWARLALCYLALSTRSFLASPDRGSRYGSVVHSAEQKLWSLMWSRKSLVSHCLFSQLC